MTDNVGRYFENRLGLPHNDDSLYGVEVDSEVGAEAVKVIDAAESLIEHIRFTEGEQSNDEYSVIEVARRVISIYWRG